jgi:hypothetical protein
MLRSLKLERWQLAELSERTDQPKRTDQHEEVLARQPKQVLRETQPKV